VVTGLNHIDRDGIVRSTDGSGKERPKFSIDSTALGGIYANAISLVGTQKGVGVNLPSEMLVQDRLEISADGQIILGKVSVRNKANIRSNSSYIEINEGVYADTLDLQALTDIRLHGNTGATSNLTLLGNDLYNDGLIAAGVNADFIQAQDGFLNLGFTESINNEGVLYGLSGTTIDTKNFINADQAEVITQTLLIHTGETLHNTGELRANLTTLDTQTLSNTGLIHANDVMRITTENFDNTQGTVEGLDSVTLNIANGFLNNNGILFSDNVLTLTTSILSNIDGRIQADETLTLSSAGNIDNTRGTLHSGTGTTVTAQTLKNEEGFIGSIKAVFLDLFDLNGDNGSISGEDVTIQTSNIQSNNATILSSGGLNIASSGDVTLTNSAMLANSELNLIAKEVTFDGSTLYSVHDILNLSSTALQAQNTYMEADQLLNLNASEHVNISDSTMKGNMIQVSTEQDVTVNNANIVAGDDLSIKAQTLNLHNASLVAQDIGTINSGIVNNSDSVVSATEMHINTTTFNNANSHLYSAGGTVNIATTGTLNNNNGLISANGNLVLDAESLDNRNGDLEAGDTLDVTSHNVQIEGSRFFAGDHLAVTSNISNIDANTKFLSSNSMDLYFAGNLIHYGEILANGRANITVRGDLSNESDITANNSLNIVANTLNNNANNTGASIRGGYLSTLILNGDLNNYGFLTSSGNLEVTATEINNYAGIAAAFDLTLNGTDLYNYQTLVSGTDMRLYISNVLRNNEDANIYAGNNLIIARDNTGKKSNKVENISARIESQNDMRILAMDISNISATEITTTLQEVNSVIDITCGDWGGFSCPDKNIALEIDLMAIKAAIIQEYADNSVVLSESELQVLLTEQMIKEDRQAYILHMYKDTQTTANELYFYELTASLDSNEMIVKRTKPHKKEEFRKVDYTVTKEIVDATSLANHKEGQIISGHNLALEADTITNKTSLIAASNDMDLRGDLANIGVGSTESLATTINYSWKRKSDGGRGQLPISKFEIRDIDGVSSRILAGGTLTGNFGVLQNGMEADTSVFIDPNAPTISTSTQTTDETQQNATNIDTNFNTPNVDQDAIESTSLALTPQVYNPGTEAITLPNDPYGLFVASEDPDGPLIEANPEYTSYNNFVSSDYLLDRLGYDGSSQMRRLGDAMYETQLIRDAIIAMTGQRYIGTAQNDNDQYTNLMNAGVSYAREVGLELGVPPTSLQLKNLKEDLV
ncbi:hypothetical protein, partial [Sulfurovum sp.]|uniref:hypothetical protein n=1 Tax=Sulfurovum sp. TaxID=1969726 RepID=UPI00356633AD